MAVFVNSRGETRRQRRLHRHNGTTLNGKQVGIRSILQDLTIGGSFLLSVVDSFGFLDKKPPENRRVCRDSTPINTAHTAQHSTTMRLAQGPKRDLHFIFVPQKKNLLSVVTCHPWLSHVLFTTSTSPSSYTLLSTTRTRSTIGTKRASPRTLRG